MPVTGKGYALTGQLRGFRFRGDNPLVKNAPGDAWPDVVDDLLFQAASTNQALTVDLFVNTNDFYAPSVAVGAVSLAPSLFSNAQVFYAPTVSRGAVSLSASRLDNTQTFFGPTVTPGTRTLTPSLFTNTNVFYGGTVYDPASITSNIRYDISTGKLVKILNNYVCISL